METDSICDSCQGPMCRTPSALSEYAGALGNSAVGHYYNKIHSGSSKLRADMTLRHKKLNPTPQKYSFKFGVLLDPT